MSCEQFKIIVYICRYAQIFKYFDKRQGFYMRNPKNMKSNFHFLTHRPPLNDLNDLENDCNKNVYIHF